MENLISIIRNVVIGVCGVFILQELASYVISKIFDKVERKVPSILSKIKEYRIEKFYAIKNSPDYKKFEREYLTEYYGLDFFTDTTKGTIPVFTVPYSRMDASLAKESIRDFDSLGNKDNVVFSFSAKEHQNYKKKKYYKEYHYLVGSKIKAPDRPGFMLKQLICDENEKMVQFRGYVGTYAENVYTNHVLEYELFKLYKKRDRGYGYLIENSVIRNSMHESVRSPKGSPEYKESMRKSLCSGEARDSLLSVQMLVLLRNGNDYDIKIIQRSKDVAVAPDRYQFVPSGGFEILNDSTNGYTDFEIKDNYSAGCAVFREYLEELFGMEEFEGKGNGSVNEALLKEERILTINRLIKEKKADFCFLGSVMDLAGLRHELSFLFVVHDEEYNVNNKFLGNEESKSKSFISEVTLSNFDEQNLIWENLHGPSAAMWMLFKNSSIYSQMIENIKSGV